MPDRTQHEQDRIAVRQGRVENVFPVSPSSLKLYDTCPRWYAFERGVTIGGAELVTKLPRVRGAAAELGDRFHRLMESLRSGEELDVAADRLGVPLESWERWNTMRDRARHFVQQENPGQLAGVEETITWRFPLPDGREVEVEARIDELWMHPDDSALIRDYKTGNAWGLPAGAQLRKEPALLCYALAVHKDNPATWRWDVELLLPESGEVRRVRFELADVERFERVLESKVRVMAADVDHAPRPGPHCSWCPYALAHCPLGAQLNGPHGSLVSQADAVRAAAFLQYVEAVQARVKSILEEWTAAEGPVRVNGGAYGKHSTVSTTIPAEHAGDAVRILRQYGIDEDSDEFPVRWDGRAGWKFLSGAEAIPELQEMTVRRHRSWFGFKKDPRPSRRGRGEGGY